MRKYLFSSLLLASTLLGLSPRDALANGAVVHAAQLSDAARASLSQEVAKARKASPDAFLALDRIAQRLPEMDAAKRGRFAPITPQLKRLGSRALLPMLERAALQSPPRGSLSDSAWKAWRLALIEASSMHRDPRALPVYLAVLQGQDDDFDVLRVTAEAIGRVGDDAALQQLIDAARKAGPRQRGLLAGLGIAQRLTATQALADAARGKLGQLDDSTLHLVAKALGDAGSAWTWKLAKEHKDEEAAVRSLAASALVDLFVANEGRPRQGATAGLLMVDDASTPQLIAQARKGATPALAAALDELAERIAKNPLRLEGIARGRCIYSYATNTRGRFSGTEWRSYRWSPSQDRARGRAGGAVPVCWGLLGGLGALVPARLLEDVAGASAGGRRAVAPDAVGQPRFGEATGGSEVFQRALDGPIRAGRQQSSTTDHEEGTERARHGAHGIVHLGLIEKCPSSGE
jgi:hypothetical protein